MKIKKYYKRFLSMGIATGQGVCLELCDGRKVKTSPVIGYDGNGRIETVNSVYIKW